MAPQRRAAALLLAVGLAALVSAEEAPAAAAPTSIAPTAAPAAPTTAAPATTAAHTTAALAAAAAADANAAPPAHANASSPKNDVAADGACRAMIKSMCGDEKSGDGRLAICLRTASAQARSKKQAEPLTEACTTEVRDFFRVAARAPVDLKKTAGSWWANLVKNLRSGCEEDAKKLCSGAPPNKVMQCLKAQKSKLSEGCKQKVFKVQQHQSEDLGLDPHAFKACEPDIAKFPACNVSDPPGAQASCLREHREELSEACRKELFRREQENSEDVRLKVKLFSMCKSEIKELCADEEFGEARVLKCLWTHSLQKTVKGFGEDCKQEVNKHARRSASDYRLDYKLRTQCDKSIEKMCAAEKAAVDNMTLVELFGGQTKDGTYLFQGKGGQVVHCLKKNFKTLHSDSCRNAVMRIVQVHSLMWDADAVTKEVCANDVTTLCGDKKGQDAVHLCLRKHLDKLSVDCKEEELLQGSLEAEDIVMKPLLLRACFSAVRDFCLGVLPGQGRVTQCLQDSMTKPDFPRHCRDRVADDLEASNHDWRLKYGISERCKDDVAELCKDVDLSTKAPILTCLKKRLHDVKSEACSSEMRRYIKQGLSNIRFAPALNAKCTNDVDEYCSEVQPGGGQVHECLLRHRDEISAECAEAEFQMQALKAADASLSPNVATKCKSSMKALCGDVKAGKGAMWACLEDNKEEDGMDADCRHVVEAEMMLKHSAFHLNLRLAQYCTADAEALCPEQLGKASFKDFHSEGAVISCLAKILSKVNGTDCKSELARKVGQRVQKNMLDPKLRDVCGDDMAKFCRESKGDAAQQFCMHQHFEQLSAECKESQAVYMAASSQLTYNWRVKRACASTVTKFCKNVQQGEGRLMQCLLMHMHHPGVDAGCRKTLEQEQAKRTKSIDFNPMIKATCVGDIKKLVDNKTCAEKSGGQGGWQLDCLTEHSEMIASAQCKQVVKFLKLRQSADVRAKPGAADACAQDINTLCPDIEAGGGRINECLRKNKEKIASDECKKKISVIWRSDKAHAATNYRIKKFCVNEIAAFCKDVEPGDSRLLGCLGLHVKEASFSEKCKASLSGTDVLDAVKKAPMSAIQAEFKQMLERHKGFFDKWGSLLMFGTVGFVSIIAFAVSYCILHRKLFHPGYNVVVPKDLES